MGGVLNQYIDIILSLLINYFNTKPKMQISFLLTCNNESYAAMSYKVILLYP